MTGTDGTTRPETLDILPLWPDSAPAIAALHRSCMGTHDGWTDAGMRRLLAAGAALGFSIWGPVEAGEGLITLPGDSQVFRSSSTMQPLAFILSFVAADEAEIIAFCVTPDHRRQGLGRHLLRRLMRELNEQGTDRLYLEVRASNFSARELYRHAGFAETGRRKGYYLGAEDAGPEDAVVMGRELSQG